MRHFDLRPEDYRKMVKDWVFNQDDERTYEYDSYSRCAVGQFLKEFPEYAPDVPHRYGLAPIWFATHQDSGSYGCAGYFVANTALHHQGDSDTFGNLKKRMNAHPMWAYL